jgi:hypothetical protein
MAATAALTGGTQALFPTPAMAMDNQGNECQNLPGWERTVCEQENGGGNGVPGGTAGGSNGSEGGQTIGHETIEVHDTRPSHCQLSPSSCLPSTQGGRHQIGSDGVRPRGPRPGHRPVRVGEVEKGTWTEGRCRKLIFGRTLTPAREAEQDAQEKAQGLLTWKFALASQDSAAERAEGSVRRELSGARNQDGTVDLAMKVAALARARRWLQLRLDLNEEKVRRAQAELLRARAEAEAEDKALRQICKQRYGLS